MQRLLYFYVFYNLRVFFVGFHAKLVRQVPWAWVSMDSHLKQKGRMRRWLTTTETTEIRARSNSG